MALKKIQIIFFLLFASSLMANDVQFTTDPELKDVNTTEETFMVNFSVAWENSWRSDIAGTGYAEPHNHDAIWVFMKYQENEDVWKHATLSTNGHIIPAGAEHTVPSDNLGVFIYRDANGAGNITLNDVELKWNYGADGLVDIYNIKIKVFAIEMVYVPQSSFSVGDGNTAAILGVFHTIGTADPFLIDSENEITLGGTTPGNLGNNHDGTGQQGGYEDDYNIGDPANEQLLPAGFPKGYNGFYIMKYNITQKQYVDFLNTLTRSQQQLRTGTSIASHLTSVTSRYVMSITDSPSSRNGIRIDYTFPANEPLVFYNDLNDDGTPNLFDDGQYLPCNYLAFADGAAYADWAGLRPLTELEYEKATRGTNSPVLNEMAWGEAYEIDVTTFVIEGITNGGETNELPTNNDANCHIDNNDVVIDGPVRAGIFATATSDRSKSGAAYYGAMDMGGTLTEQVISTGSAEGRAFDGVHGDGELSIDGVNNVINWPGSGSTIINAVIGAGIRSNSFASVGMGSRISVRRFVNQAQTGRSRSMGFRLVRTFP